MTLGVYATLITSPAALDLVAVTESITADPQLITEIAGLLGPVSLQDMHYAHRQFWNLTPPVIVRFCALLNTEYPNVISPVSVTLLASAEVLCRTTAQRRQPRVPAYVPSSKDTVIVLVCEPLAFRYCCSLEMLVILLVAPTYTTVGGSICSLYHTDQVSL